MNWQELLDEGWIEEHQTSQRELNDLRKVVARDLADAEVPGLSVDRQFATAYNAALQSTKMVIACCGYRVRGVTGAHHMAFECLKVAMGRSIYKTANFLDKCRRKRNIADYDSAGRISKGEAKEMIQTAKFLARRVEGWISENYPVYSR
jgi:uncharacterized protein (UPF0332 family)